MLRLLGIDQRAATEAGEGAYAVAEAQIRWLAPARLDDALLDRNPRDLNSAPPASAWQQRVLRGDDLLAQVDDPGRLRRPRRPPAPPACCLARGLRSIFMKDPHDRA